VPAIAGLIIVAAGAGYLASSLSPEKPNLASNSGYQGQATSYRAGGADCQPTEIKPLSNGERARRAVACQEAEEEHRLKTDDLIQQRRSADAANAMTILSYEQTKIATWGIALGFITMFAAIAAAFYARSAAVHSDNSHKTFINAERAVLRVVRANEAIITGHGNGRGVIAVTFKNIGRTPARINSFSSKTHGSAPRWADIPANETGHVAGQEILIDKNTVLDGWFWIDYSIIGGGSGRTNFRMTAAWSESDGFGPAGWFYQVFNTDGHPDDT
jgi:hypothetical protein